MIEKMSIVREAFFAGLHAGAPDMPVSQQAVVALDGAIWRAHRMIGEVS